MRVYSETYGELVWCGMKKFILMFSLISVFVGADTWASNDALEEVKQKFSKETQEKNDKQWRACSGSSECVVIQGECDLKCVNKSFKQQAELYYGEYGTMISCESIQHKSMPQPICHQAQCICEYPNEIKS